MKINVFSIPSGEIAGLKTKLSSSGMTVIKEVDQDDWHGEFYYSTKPDPVDVPWAEVFQDYFKDLGMPTNASYFAAFLFTRADRCFALSYGKSHFYLRPYCDYDFGIELAKRIANEFDIRQTASKRFQGKKKKELRSYTSNTRLDVESGESVDYFQAAVVDTQHSTYGKSGKFGTSALLSPDISAADIGPFLTKLAAELARPARFKLPRTTVVTEESEIEDLDRLLVNELTSPVGTTDFTHNSYDLYGIDFVFSNDGSFQLRCPGYAEIVLDELSIKDLKDYIASKGLQARDVLRIRVVHEQEGRPKFTQGIKEALDFIADDERVVLTNGRWMRFNQDYLQFLDDYLENIRVEETEPAFRQISATETVFNQSEEIRQAGYEVADKDFSILRTRSSTLIEAWDLKKDSCVYAVKFGTAQKLGPVCDQATAVLELLRNKAGVNQIPGFDQYCLWLGYRSKNNLDKITRSGSIILKQKIEAWARKARELGVEPVLKISQKVRSGFDS